MKDVFILFIMCSAWVGWGTTEVAITQDEEFITLWYNSSNTHIATFKVNFNLPRGMTCDEGTVWYMCVTDDNYWGPHCDSWGAVGWNTGDTDWGYRPEAILQRKDKNGKPLLDRLTLLKPLCVKKKKVKLVITVENPSANDAGTYVIGGYGGMASGYKAGIKLKDMFHSPEWRTEEKQTTDIIHLAKSHMQMYNEMVAISDPTVEEVYAVETGYSGTNYWLEWMKYTAAQYNRSNCYVCSSARPHLGSVPLHLDPASERCFLSLFTNSTTNNPICETWKVKYPIITQAPTRSQGITIYPGNYTCFVSEGEGRNLGKFEPGYCGSYSNATRDQLLNQVQSVADVFWICGDMKIRPKLEGNWTGECALAKALMPLHVIPLEDGKMEEVFSF
ncbi:uncharacterized protein [Dendropsophus ebraccatus]|uniref:uncharacterized protein n=1 Tax=Dendropsophus ebraccatus TaxID=150705 RepID=UPI00383225AB